MHSLIRNFSIALAVFTVVGLITPTADAQQPAKRSITNIAGDLYRFQNNFHFSVFLVTPDGVIVTDPINADAAEWLKAEIAKRFNLPIKYLIYSHDHRDHIAGGEVFADTATVVAHANAKEVIIGEKRPTAVPDVTFTDTMTIELGGKVVELTYVGESHSNNSIVMNFPEERTLFVVDLIAVNRLPYQTLRDAYFPGWMNALKKIEGMDFDILAPGHGKIGKKSDVAPGRMYLEDLYAAVLTGLREEQMIEQMQSSILLEKYKDFGQYDKWRTMNIIGMAANISLHRRGN